MSLRPTLRPARLTRRRRALTLLELSVVMTIVAMLAALVIVMVGDAADTARLQATEATLREVQAIILNRYALDMAGKSSVSSHLLVRLGLPGPSADLLVPAGRISRPQLAFLFVNPLTNGTAPTYDPVSGRGWRGPYLLISAGRYPGMDPDSSAVARGFTTEYGVPNSSPGAGDGDPTVLDGWGHPVVIQGSTLSDARLVSAGPDGNLLETSDNLSLPLTLP